MGAAPKCPCRRVAAGQLTPLSSRRGEEPRGRGRLAAGKTGREYPQGRGGGDVVRIPASRGHEGEQAGGGVEGREERGGDWGRVGRSPHANPADPSGGVALFLPHHPPPRVSMGPKRHADANDNHDGGESAAAAAGGKEGASGRLGARRWPHGVPTQFTHRVVVPSWRGRLGVAVRLAATRGRGKTRRWREEIPGEREIADVRGGWAAVQTERSVRWGRSRRLPARVRGGA